MKRIKHPEARAELLRLIPDYDVLIEGFRPGVMARLGLGYETLREINPGLIDCSLSGYGATGPRVQAAGHDANYLAEAGVLHRNGGADPVFFDPPLADVSGSLFGVIAILGALRGLVRRAPHGALQALFPARIDGHSPDSRPAVAPSRQPSRVSPGGDGGAIPKRIAPYVH